MRRAVPLLLLVPVIALAAPIPAPSEKEQIAKLWGKVYAPSDKYEFKLNGKALTIRTAGEPTHEAFAGKPSTIPRVSRTVTGDFEATVKVMDAAFPNAKGKYEAGGPDLRAGLFVEGGFKFLDIELFQYYGNNNGVLWEKPNRVVWFNVRGGGKGEGRHVQHAEPNKPLYLRITRKGKVVTMAHCFDGKEWGVSDVPLAYQPLELPDEVTVGVFLAHSTHQIADATFSDFTLEQPNKK
jgi:hypothetical protein